MSIMLTVKSIAGAVTLCAIGLTIYFVQQFVNAEDDGGEARLRVQKKEEWALKAKLEQVKGRGSEPGEKAYQNAVQLLEKGPVEVAEARLKYVVSNYPSANSAVKARKILGEINMDRLLDPSDKKGKVTVEVKSGDNFTRIINKNQTTMDSLAHFSGLMRADAQSLHPGDKLTVLPLNMRLVIDVKRKRVTLFDGENFIKDYTVLKASYEGSGVLKTKVSSIRGSKDGKNVSPHSVEYRASNKTIFLTDKSIMLRSEEDKSGEDYALGCVLSQADMEELPLLLCPGNEIEIRR